MLLYVLLNKLTVFLLHQLFYYFCWTQPFVWKALSYVALVLYSTSSRWKQQPKRSHVHSYSFPPKLSAHQRHWIMQIVFSCTSEHRKTHIWHERDSLSFVCGFSEKAAAPALLCLFAAWGLKPLPFRHPCHRCCLSNVSLKRRWDSGTFAPLDAARQQPQPLPAFKQWNQTLSMQKGSLFSPSRCRQSSVLLIHLPRLSPVSNDSKSSSVTAFWRASSHISARPTHLSAENKVMMICQDHFVLEICHSRLLHHCGTQKRTVMLVVMCMHVKFVVKSHWSAGNITFIITVV